MLSCVMVVQNNVHSFSFLQDEGICVLAIDNWVYGGVARRQGGVECGHLGHDVGDVIEEGTLVFCQYAHCTACAGHLLVGAVAKESHLHIECDRVIRSVKL